MPDDTKAIETRGEIVPAHLSDRAKDGSMKPAQLRSGAGIAPVIPTTLEEAYRYAVAVVRAGLAPDSYNVGGNGQDKDQPDPEKVLIGILKSLEVGMPPITGLSTIAIINKRPTIWGDGAVALIQSHGLVERTESFFEGSAERAAAPAVDGSGETNHAPTLIDFSDGLTAVFRIWRKGQETPYEGRFSVRDAKRAHLWANPKRQPWMLYPKRMLTNRARAFALRDGFADALAGLAIREEVEDLPMAPAKPADVSFLDDEPPTAALQIEHSTETQMPPVVTMEQPKEIVTASLSDTGNPSDAPASGQKDAAVGESLSSAEPDLLSAVPSAEIAPQTRGNSGLFYWREWEQRVRAALLSFTSAEQVDEFRRANQRWISESNKANPDHKQLVADIQSVADRFAE